MKSFYKLLLLFILLPFFAKAQSNYKPGYVITAHGDTLNGLINLREWELNPKFINFKGVTGGTDIKNLKPVDIKFFEITNFESYKTYIGPVSTDKTDISNLPTYRDTSSRTDSVFLKIVQKGKNVTLYAYTDEIKSRYFISDKNNNEPVELNYRVYSNDTHTVNEQRFMNQLYLLAQKYGDAPEKLQTQIARSEYNLPDLIAIARKINNVSEKEESTGNNKGTFYFAGAGLNIATVTSNVFEKAPHTSYFPRIAAGLDVLANPHVGRFVLRFEAAITDNAYKSSNSYMGQTNTFSFDQYTFSLIPQLLYNVYNSDQLKIYIDGGVSLNYSAYTGNKFRSGNTEIADYFNLMHFWTSFPLKAGAVINKKVDVFVTYMPKATFTDALLYYIQVSAVQIGFNYIFR